jgi:hypothetical protein
MSSGGDGGFIIMTAIKRERIIAGMPTIWPVRRALPMQLASTLIGSSGINGIRKRKLNHKTAL